MSLLDVHAPHPQLRSRATVLVGAGHIAVALLLALDKARYGARPRGDFGAAADHPVWALVHVLTGLVVLASTRVPHETARQLAYRRRLDLSLEHPVRVVLALLAAGRGRLACRFAARAVRPRLRCGALLLAFGVMMGWALLMLIWAISLEPDGTWAVGVLGVAHAGVALVLADREE